MSTRFELEIAAVRAEIARPDGWHRSARGTLTRTWGGRQGTVYRRGRRWHWCLLYKDGSTARSGVSSASECEALSALCTEMARA
jgi:hypothetical protein